MKYQLMASACLLSLLTGCSSTMKSGGVSVSEPDGENIYNAKAAYCELFDYRSSNRFSGNNPKESPEARKAEKDRVWSSWQDTRKELASDLKGKLFFVSHPAGFFKYDEKTKLLKFNERSRVSHDNSNILSGLSSRNKKLGLTVLQGAIPNQVLFNVLGISKYGLIIPSGSYIDRGRRSVSRHNVAWAAYGNSQNGHDGYVINTYEGDKIKTRSGAYGGKQLDEFENVQVLGVEFDTKTWYENEGSPIIEQAGQFYLDANKFDFMEVFEEYPDISKPYVDILYSFEFNGCSGNIAQADLKEVVVKSRSTDKELFRVSL